MAVIADNLYKVNLEFTLGGGDDIAVMGFHARCAEPAPQAQLVAEHARDTFTANWTATGIFSGAVVGTRVLAYKLDGSYHSTARGEAGFGVGGDPGFVGSGGPDSLPWECALAVTLYTYGASEFVPFKGRRRRGRMYLPPIAKARLVGGAGLIEDAGRNGARDSLKSWFDAFNDVLPGTTSQIRAVVLSKPDVAIYDVTRIGVDNKIDSQRRRENRQDVGVIRVLADLAP